MQNNSSIPAMNIGYENFTQMNSNNNSSVDVANLLQRSAGGSEAGGTGSSAVGVPGGMTNGQSPLGMNIGTGQLALGAIGTIGNLWAAWQAQKMAKKQFNFQKGITNTNLANQIQTYNTALTGRAETRGFMQGDSEADTAAFVEQNQLRDNRNERGA